MENISVGLSWANKLKNQFDAFGAVSPPSMVAQGQPRRFIARHRKRLSKFLEQNPSAYQDEIVDFLAEEFEIFMHRITVSRLLKGVDITRKKIERAHTERNGITGQLVSSPYLLYYHQHTRRTNATSP